MYHCTGGDAGDWGSLKGDEGAVLKTRVGDESTNGGWSESASGVYPWRVKEAKTGGGGREMEEGPALREDWVFVCMVRRQDAVAPQRSKWARNWVERRGMAGVSAGAGWWVPRLSSTLDGTRKKEENTR